MVKNTEKKWFVYILRCSDMSLYTGITNDILRRLDEHNHSRLGAKYTKARRPVRLVYSAPFSTRSLASKKESEIKKMSKVAKEKLVKEANTAVFASR